MKQKGITTKTILDACEFKDRHTVYDWYSGKRLPSVQALISLSDVLGIKIDDLLIWDWEETDDCS